MIVGNYIAEQAACWWIMPHHVFNWKEVINDTLYVDVIYIFP